MRQPPEKYCVEAVAHRTVLRGHKSSCAVYQQHRVHDSKCTSLSVESRVHASTEDQGSQILIVWSTLPDATTFTNFSTS